MRKAIIIILSIAAAAIVASQADAKGKKTTTNTIVLTKHYDKSSPVLKTKTQGPNQPQNPTGLRQTGQK